MCPVYTEFARTEPRTSDQRCAVLHREFKNGAGTASSPLTLVKHYFSGTGPFPAGPHTHAKARHSTRPGNDRGPLHQSADQPLSQRSHESIPGPAVVGIDY